MDRSRASSPSRRPFSPSATSRFIEDAQHTRILVKDQNYFRDKTWNNSYLASGKIYSFYHNKENELLQRQAELKERMRQEQSEARRELFDQRATQHRKTALKSLMSVTRTRMDVQVGASQPVLDGHFDGLKRLSAEAGEAVGRRRASCNNSPKGGEVPGEGGTAEELFGGKSSVQMLRLMNRKPSLLWNKVTRLNAKNLDLLLTPEVLKMDRRAFIEIQSKQRAEMRERELLAQRRQFLHDFIRGRGRPAAGTACAESKQPKEAHHNKFMQFDDPALNGLYMNDVLRVKGVAQNNALKKVMKANSLLRTLKDQEGGSLPRRAEKPAAGAGRRQGETGDDFFRVDEYPCDISQFEENLKKLSKFKEGRYPRINLDKGTRFHQQVN